MVHGVSMRRIWKALVVAFIGLDVSLAYSGKMRVFILHAQKVDLDLFREHQKDDAVNKFDQIQCKGWETHVSWREQCNRKDAIAFTVNYGMEQPTTLHNSVANTDFPKHVLASTLTLNYFTSASVLSMHVSLHVRYLSCSIEIGRSKSWRTRF
jgi:hypothetical protein